ncbi:MAG: hypothetical protein K9W43_14365, partial [Candidatus Thorarchaeota archaeon]|nr:hypothetical protein [Candidatus Thorarchaeota archaeon]
NMTIIQASICADEDCILLIGDRMITYSETYEYEEKIPKIYQIGQFGVGFAGSLESITFVKDKLKPTKTFSEFIEQFEVVIKKENTRRLNDFIEKKYFTLS